MTPPNSPISDILAPSLDVFRYPGTWGADSRCGVRVLTLYGRTTVILSELHDNPGTAVTNRAELIATMLLADCLAGLNPTEIRWIKHDPSGQNQKQETFDWIEFSYGRSGHVLTDARRRRLFPLEVEDLRAALIQEAH